MLLTICHGIDNYAHALIQVITTLQFQLFVNEKLELEMTWDWGYNLYTSRFSDPLGTRQRTWHQFIAYMSSQKQTAVTDPARR